MKKLVILLLLLSIPALAEDSFRTPKDLVNSFLNPMKKGVKGLDQSSQNLNGETGSEARSELRDVMKQSGKLVNVTLKESDTTKLGGSLQKFVYELKFANGTKKEIYFKIIRPQQDGEFMLMDVNVE